MRKDRAGDKRLNSRAANQYYLPYIMSGLLFGLSWPSYPYVRLEFLAWIWMVPILLALKPVKSFWRFLLNTYLAMFIFSIVGMSWLITSTTLGTIFLFFVSAFIHTVPFVAFFLVRQTLGWRVTLWSAPVVWTAWEWLYHQSEGSIGWMSMGPSQSNLYLLVQYVDITGVWGVTFWLVLFNVLVVMAVEDWQAARGIDDRESRVEDRGSRIEDRGSKIGSPGLLHPLSSIFHALSSIFYPLSSIFTSRSSKMLARRVAVVLMAMLLPPLAYSTYVFVKDSRAAASGREISVLMVQPNIDPWRKSDANTRANTLGKTLALTDAGVARHKPDLIIWPETAVPYFFLDGEAAQEFVKRSVSRWNVPLLTGTLDRRAYEDSQALKPLRVNEQGNAKVFNAAVLLTPEPPEADQTLTLQSSEPEETAPGNRAPTKQRFNVKTSLLYHKRVLMPFAERVPFVDQFPALSRLAINVGGGGGFSPGREATVFSFKDPNRGKVTVAAAICYEQQYPAEMAEFVRNGAEMLALITNEGWWSQTHGAYQMAAFTRVRAIETRRSIARCANTGVTCLIDPMGRIHDQAPWWSEQTVIGNVRLSKEMSVYVRYPDYFPKACLWLVLGLAMAAIIQEARSLVGGSRSVVQAEL
jgi:apolipoprotein N-acyltransferase